MSAPAFKRCASCEVKAGSDLCDSCLHNLALISRLRQTVDELLHEVDYLCHKIWPSTETPRHITRRVAELQKEWDL